MSEDMMMNGPALARREFAAGWYRDPRGEGATRWWDGEDWTEAIQGAPPAPSAAAPSPPVWEPAGVGVVPPEAEAAPVMTDEVVATERHGQDDDSQAAYEEHYWSAALGDIPVPVGSSATTSTVAEAAPTTPSPGGPSVGVPGSAPAYDPVAGASVGASQTGASQIGASPIGAVPPGGSAARRARQSPTKRALLVAALIVGVLVLAFAAKAQATPLTHSEQSAPCTATGGDDAGTGRASISSQPGTMLTPPATDPRETP